MTTEFNTLVISDLHLGEDLGLSATMASTRHLEVTSAQLIQFLRYYSRRRADGRPWRLVINGDMVDFLAICVMPGESGDFGEEFTPDELVYGMGRRPRVARAKMEAVLDRHADFFRALVEFLGAGNRVDIVAGNHDVELQFEPVQQALVDGLVALWQDSPMSRRHGAPDADTIRERIGFHPWFFYEKGVAWIEHGHQYDECSSFDNALVPVAPDGKHIATNVDAATLRYLTNRFDDVEPHSVQEWSFVGYLRLTLGLGVRSMFKMIGSYFSYVASLLAVWRTETRPTRANRDLREQHRAKRRRLGSQWQLSESTLTAVDRLRRRPVVGNLGRLLSVAMVDRVAINLLALLAVVLTFVFAPLIWAIPGTVGITVGSYLVSSWAARRRKIDPESSLGAAAGRILGHVDARFVVLSHTHEPVDEELPSGRRYFNTGTWMATTRPGLLRSFTHVVIRHGPHGPTARLRQWRDGASRDFTPGWVPTRRRMPTEDGLTEQPPVPEPEAQVA